MLIREFIEKFEELIPTALQDDWDNSGFQLGKRDQEITKILTCLDATEDIIDQAIEEGANLILAHHPIFFRATKQIDEDYFISKKIIKAIKNDIAIYASHTAIDINEKGLNQFVFKEMGFKSKEKLQVTLDTHGYGDICQIPPRPIRHFADQIKERLDLDHVILYGDEDKEVSRIALVTGSGASFIKDCIEKKVDLYITADIGHHDALDSLEQGLSLLDLGHYGSEKLFNQIAKDLVGQIDPQIQVLRENAPEKYLRKII